MRELFNGAKLPNWAYLFMAVMLVCFNAGIIWAVNKSTIATLQQGQVDGVKAQERTSDEIVALRSEMRDRLVTKSEFDLLRQRVESNSRRIDALDDQIWARKVLR